MTNIPKLKAEALERAAEAIAQSMRVGTNTLLYLPEAKVAITAYHAHIAKALVEEDERKMFEKWDRNFDRRIEGMPPYTALEVWQAALRACPYKQIICGDEG